MTRFTFSVDAALLRELGERLVGQPHIALAELVKNAYDADATRVSIEFGDDRIVVTDDGDGMSSEEFRSFWMRIGSPHKRELVRTRRDRVPTGSKGIGRLAVQFLGTDLRIRTSPRSTPDHELTARIDWTAAHNGDLNGIDIEGLEGARSGTYAGGSFHGTEIVVSRLNQEWDDRSIRALAQQIWQLQSPFRNEALAEFRVDLKHPQKVVVRDFATEMSRNLDIWSARLRGRLLPRRAGDPSRTSRIRLLLEFAGEEPIRHDYVVADSNLHHLDFEIRLFSLYNKQRYGIGVEHARRYLREHGGVHVYDGSFRLPYYGPDTDWLKIEIDHSHRIVRSKLLPDELQVENGLTNLPTMSRIYGIVNVDTTREWLAARAERQVRLNEYLQIQVSRDRLVDNPSFRALRDAVRYAVDFYAVNQTARSSGRSAAPAVPAPIGDIGRVAQVLESFREELPKRTYDAISREIRKASAAQDAASRKAATELENLGHAAAAGTLAAMLALGTRNRLNELERRVAELRSEGDRSGAEATTHAATELRPIQDAFRLLDPGASTRRRSDLSARSMVHSLAVLFTTVRLENSVDENVVLPSGTSGEWGSFFSCLLADLAEAAVVDPSPSIRIRSRSARDRICLRFSRNGSDPHGPSSTRRKRGSAPAPSSSWRSGAIEVAARRLGVRLENAEPETGFAAALEVYWSR